MSGNHIRPWSKIRDRLEHEYLADALRGRLTYFATTYHATHDGDEGRVALRLDGTEILKSNYYDRFGAAWQAYYRRMDAGMQSDQAWRQAPYDAMEQGEFYQMDFYRAFREFDSQSIAESLHSENAVVRMFALLDRRTGKRTLEALRIPMRSQPEWLQMIYYLRLEAEGLPLQIEPTEGVYNEESDSI